MPYWKAAGNTPEQIAFIVWWDRMYIVQPSIDLLSETQEAIINKSNFPNGCQPAEHRNWNYCWPLVSVNLFRLESVGLCFIGDLASFRDVNRRRYGTLLWPRWGKVIKYYYYNWSQQNPKIYVRNKTPKFMHRCLLQDDLVSLCHVIKWIGGLLGLISNSNLTWEKRKLPCIKRSFMY